MALQADRFVRPIIDDCNRPKPASLHLQLLVSLRRQRAEMRSDWSRVRGAKSSLGVESQTERSQLLDAPELRDDFYSQPLSWSKLDWLAVALYDAVWTYDCSVLSGRSNKSRSEPRQLRASPLRRDANSLETNDENVDPSSESVIKAVQWHHSGRIAAFSRQDGTIELNDFETNQTAQVRDKNCESFAECLDWHSDSLAIGCMDGRIELLDARQLSATAATMPTSSANRALMHESRVAGVKWSPDGKLLAAGCNENSVAVWDVRRLSKPAAEFREARSAIKALAWMNDSTLYTGGGIHDCCVRKYNCLTNEMTSAGASQSQITSLHCNEQRKELVSSHRNGGGAITMWQANLLQSRVIKREMHGVIGAALSGDARHLAAAETRGVISFWPLWQTKTKPVRLNLAQRLRRAAAIR